MKIPSLLIAMFMFHCSYGQWFNNISTFTTQNGLSNNTITCLQKDGNGFLWIGTHEGLNRYDGTAFVNVLSNSKNNLPSNNITKIFPINKTLLAIATEGGLCLLNTATLTGKVIALPFNPKFPNTGYYIEDVLYNGATKELWVAGWHGVFVLNEEGKILRKLMAPGDVGRECFAKYLFKDGSNSVYFFSHRQPGFFYIDFEKQDLLPVEKKIPAFTANNFVREKAILRSAQMLDHEMTCIFSKGVADGDGQFIVYYNNLTGRYFTDQLTINIPAEKRFLSAFPLTDSSFIINSYFGEPLLYNANRHQTIPLSDKPLWFTSWPDGFAATILKEDNNIWVATSKGLLQSPLKTNFFNNNALLINTLKTQSGMVSYNYGIYDSSKLWVACMGAGLFSLDTATNKIEAIFNKQTNPAITKKLISTEILKVGKALWLFSVYGPIQVDPNNNKLSLIEGVNKDPAFDDITSYPLKDNNGNIWSTLPNGIAQYNIATASFTNHKTKYEGGNFPLLRALTKTQDGKGNIWMARQDSLVKFDVAKNAYTVILLKKNDKALRPITNLASDGDDVLYMNVAGAFGMYHISTNSIDLFTKQTGINSTAISEIVCDKEGNAWLATEGGLIFYNKQKRKFSSFTKADGLPDDDVIGVNFTDDTKEVLFLGFAKSYCLFKPQNFFGQRSVPQNTITGIEVDGALLNAEEKQVLSYEQNSISFTYTGINFNQGQLNNYACMLEGFDKDWKYTGTERKINYVNLPPAKYTFKVKSANHQGEWNEQPATFSFEILPPFWQQWWFRILLFCAIVFGIYYFIKRREWAIEKENKLKLQMSELRMQALRAQMNPHFIFNSLNSIQNYILSNNTIDAAGYLSKFAKLMRRILDQSKHNFLPLGEVMETLKMYVEIEAFRFNNEFTYHFDIEDNDDLLDAGIPPMLLQPFAENAILHGLMPKTGSKQLYVSCTLVKGNIEIIIDDNGIGRTQLNAKAGHDSQGEKLTTGMLESMQQLQHIKATIAIIDKKENGIAAGTTVKLVLPLK